MSFLTSRLRAKCVIIETPKCLDAYRESKKRSKKGLEVTDMVMKTINSGLLRKYGTPKKLLLGESRPIQLV